MHHKAQMAGAIHREIAYVFQRYLGDVRLKSIAVITVKLSKKLDYADIKVTQLDSHYSPTETIHILQKAAPKIRHYLAKIRSHTYKTPKLRFHYDTSLTKSMYLHQVLNESIHLQS